MIARAAIVGVGLLGGSVALALRRARAAQTIAAWDPSRDALADACALGAVDVAAASLADACADADVVVLAAPVGDIARVIGEIAPCVAPGALVTDVGSTKTSIVAAAARAFGAGGVHANGAIFVGAHPLAGGENPGVQHARATLFDDAVVLLTPEDDTPLDGIERATRLWESLGARVHIALAAEHDRVLAVTSHLPHAVSCALMRVVAARVSIATLPRFSGPGLRDMTRLASSGAGIWTDILVENRAAVLDALEAARADMDALACALEAEDREAVATWLEDAARARADLLDAPRA